MTAQRGTIALLSLLILLTGVVVAYVRVHAQDYTVLPDGTTLGTSTPLEGVNVAPDGSVLTNSTALAPSALPVGALVRANGVLLNIAATGTTAEKTNFSLLYGKLDYVSKQLDQVQETCAQR
jgi:hypothetical protein